ncbi:pentapeptide repeat-containing protein [Clostridium baratii]|uniref:pentapeptide repeat-containing protein n=1 Tax=Clostridium baratii TaxID=1561 RepID=UPI0030CC0F98
MFRNLGIVREAIGNLNEERLKELYDKSIIFDKGGWNELEAIKNIFNDKNVSLESLYPNEFKDGKFKDMYGKELVPYYEKGYFGEDYKNKEEYKVFRKEVMKEALINNLMYEDNFFSSIQKHYSDIENDKISKEEREGLNFEFKEEFGVTYKEYMDNKKVEDEIKNYIKNELNNLGGLNMNKINQKEIEKMVIAHEEWLRTNGKSGNRLDLEGKELKGIRLLNVDLENASFKDTVIKDCAIFANLKGANFEGSKIDNVEFIGSNIKGVKIGAKELELINIQINEEEFLHKEANKTLKTNINKEHKKEKIKEAEYEM